MMTKEEAKEFIAQSVKSDVDMALVADAIKALEQEPCEDAISRQIISDYVESHIQEINTGYGDLNKHTNRILRMIMEYIDKLPSFAQEPKTGHWIPVSERLPNFNDIVLASTNSDYDELRVILTVYSGEEFWFNGKIKAWMPLPEPYKAESEDKECLKIALRN